jgi:hypothetical protein
MFKVFISDSVYQNITTAEEKKSLSERSYLYKLLNKKPVHILTPEEEVNIKNNPKEVLNNPSSLYILNISPEKAFAIEQSYGVMCLSGENPDISPLIDVEDYFKPSKIEKKFKGWDRVLDTVENLPSNALVLRDRYLFKYKGKKEGDGITNVRSILDELLPEQFEGVEYHITIVFGIGENAYSFKEIIAELDTIAHELRSGYNIMIEIFGVHETSCLFYDSHDRQIVSNYYFVEASHKLAAFKYDDVGIVDQSITPWALFTRNSLDSDSSAPLEAIEQTREDFRNFYANISSETNRETYFYAINGKRLERCTGVKNRLLK